MTLKIAKIQSPHREICHLKCEICKVQNAHGNHFGVYSCRACAAFFRRTVHSRWSQLKCQGGSCNKITFFCKPCRLQKCFESGMVTANFQYNRDGIISSSPPAITTASQIPTTLEQFLGRPHFVMLSDKNPKKTIIDLHRLLGEATKILNLGPATPIFCEGSQLKKLSFGLKNPFYLEKLKLAKRMTKSEIAANWEFYVKKVASWLTHFDEYKKLGIGMQMKLLQTIWHIWSRLEKLSTTAKYRRCSGKGNYKTSEIVVQHGVLVDIENVDFESKWMSDFPTEQVRNFMMHSSCDQFSVTDALCEMELTDVELTYMLAQLCFQYAGNRCQGEILEVCEKFLAVLSDDLHDYYVNEMNMPRYFQRLAKMMQINREIQCNIRRGRDRMLVIHTFNILKLEFTHPEMFKDSGFH